MIYKLHYYPEYDIFIDISIRCIGYIFLLFNLTLVTIPKNIYKIIITGLYIILCFYFLNILPNKRVYWLLGIILSIINLILQKFVKTKLTILDTISWTDIILFCIFSFLGNIFYMIFDTNILFNDFLLLATVNILIIGIIYFVDNIIKNIILKKKVNYYSLLTSCCL
jgi:hypothetical protein